MIKKNLTGPKTRKKKEKEVENNTENQG